MLNQSNILADLYGTLATVLAVTIALQQQVVASCFDECKQFSHKIEDAQQRQENLSSLFKERKKILIQQIRVNVPAVLVNALIIVPWGYVGLRYRPTDEPSWLYILPFYGICSAAAFLFIVVVFSLVSLYFERRILLIVTIIVSTLIFLFIIAAGILIRP